MLNELENMSKNDWMIFEKRSNKICYITTKVHSFLWQCLHDLQFTKCDGTFTKTFSWCQLRLLSLKGLMKVPPNWVNRRLCKKCLKNEWTLRTTYLNGYGGCLRDHPFKTSAWFGPMVIRSQYIRIKNPLHKQ